MCFLLSPSSKLGNNVKMRIEARRRRSFVYNEIHLPAYVKLKRSADTLSINVIKFFFWLRQCAINLPLALFLYMTWSFSVANLG